MWDFLDHRNAQPEWMDQSDVDPQELRRSLAFIRRVNRFIGYTRATIRHLSRLSRGWKNGQRITLLDCATGSADIPLAILGWAARRGFDVHIIGIELHRRTAQIAAEVSGDRLTIVRADARQLPLADGAVDYALTAMFLHHLSEDDAVTVLREMDRVSRRGIIAADLLRDKHAYGWIRLLTLFSNPMVRHDAAVSVAQAFSPPEVRVLRDRAGLGYAEYFEHFGHRFVLAGHRDGGDNR
ncbi:MAG TPA: methyltransferase domain-containing protein [Tepidisphaeraceae bacterium]|nr:methyltransferase domain-containing protein [Tepidisphaeraceae bacterium]